MGLTYHGTGMKSYSRLDKELFDKYFNDRASLEKEVEKILSATK